MAKTYGVGIIGAGNISAAYLRLAPLFRNLEVRAIADIIPEAAKKRAEEYKVAAQTPDELLKNSEIDVVVNLTITGTPFGDERMMHMGARDGQGHWGIGHLDGADVTLTTDYATAKDVFVSGNPQAGMQAFMAGKVKVQGDMTKLMMAQQGGGPGGNAALQEAIQGITE